MDKSWMQIQNRLDHKYNEGLKEFINFATTHVDALGRSRCPCKKCRNSRLKKFSEVKQDLIRYGIVEDYTNWVYHEESFSVNNSEQQSHDSFINETGTVSECIPELLEDLQKGTFMNTCQQEGNVGSSTSSRDVEKFSRLWSESQKELYPGCEKYSRLSFLVKIVHNKIMTKTTIKSFNMNLELFKDALPNGETLPKNYYEVRKVLRDLGLGYTNIDACPRDCILYWKENESLNHCLNLECELPRWKDGTSKHSKIPQKVAQFFPIKPRLQRLFMSKDIAKYMRWHKEKRVDDGVLRHPTDAQEWKDFDSRYRWFSQDPRNIRLGLSSDGFNPFGNMSTSYNMWPVFFLVVYKLPPWLCMKEPFFMLVLLIPGKDSPGNDIAVYMRPVIDELRDLWINGVEIYDSYTCETFRLHAALLWKINDFLALGMLFGWCTKRKLACPICNKNTDSCRLKHGSKECYMAHRRFLDEQHKWMRSRKFNGKFELRSKPNELSGDDILRQLEYIPNDLRFGKSSDKKKRKRGVDELNWTKKSIFFKLLYWKTLKIRHNLDLMHIEKNICENILGTLMDSDGKTKDGVKARMDLEDLEIKKDLHLQQDANGNVYMPLARYTLDRAKRKKLREWFKNLKFPDGYASNITQCVNVVNGKIQD